MNERTVFLWDGAGAALSFIFSGFILPSFAARLGLSRDIIYSLASLAALCMIFSFSCYTCAKSIRSWMLRSIILANLSYCLISGGLILFHKELTDPGRYLLAAEILLVAAVIALELKVYQKFFRT